MIGLVFAAVVVGLLVYGVHHLMKRSEGRGEQHRGGSGALGNAFLEVQTMFDPAKKPMLEERRKEKTEGREEGGPPEGGERR